MAKDFAVEIELLHSNIKQIVESIRLLQALAHQHQAEISALHKRALENEFVHPTS